MGLKWICGESYDIDNWEDNKNDTCYDFHNGIYYSLRFLSEKNCRILTAKDFLIMHQEPFMGYFESDGTEETYNNIIKILDILVPNNRHHAFNFKGDVKGYYYFVEEGEMDCVNNDIMIYTDYHKCNLDHYLHLVTKTNPTIADEMSRLCKELSESRERERLAQNIIDEKCKEIEGLKIKASKWDAMFMYGRR